MVTLGESTLFQGKWLLGETTLFIPGKYILVNRCPTPISREMSEMMIVYVTGSCSFKTGHR